MVVRPVTVRSTLWPAAKMAVRDANSNRAGRNRAGKSRQTILILHTKIFFRSQDKNDGRRGMVKLIGHLDPFGLAVRQAPDGLATLNGAR
jgi:hypothetical protein